MVSEVCAEEGLDLLLAFDFGPPGMCTLRASITRVALTKACTLALLAGAFESLSVFRTVRSHLAFCPRTQGHTSFVVSDVP
jgi:hypothetical protein